MVIFGARSRPSSHQPAPPRPGCRSLSGHLDLSTTFHNVPHD